MKETKPSMSRRIWDTGLAMVQSYGLAAAAGAEMSDMELRNVLHDALRANEPGFDGILEVFADSGVVIYATVPENDLLLYQRSFSRDEEGAVSLADDRELVEPVTEFKPVAAEAVSEAVVEAEEEDAAGDEEPVAAKPEQAAKSAAEPVAEPVQAKSVSSGCGCGGEGVCACSTEPKPVQVEIGGMQSAPANQPSMKAAAKRKGVRMSDANVKYLVARLITNDRTPFTGDDEEALLAFPEERLKALEESLTEEFIAPEPPPEPEPMTDEEWIAAAPAGIRGLFQRFQDEDQKQRNLLINSLVRVQEHYNKKQLEAKPTEELEILCEMLKIHAPKRDYSGRGLVARFSDTNDEGVPTPPNMGRYIQAKRAGKSRDEAMREARSAN